MKIKYLLLSGLFLGLVACEKAPKKEEAAKQETKQEQKVEKKTKAIEKKETKQVAQATAGAGSTEHGKNVFQSKGCAACHQPAADSVGPSLKKIAQAYGSVDELVKFLKGEAKPKVWPQKFAIMKPQLNQIKDLSEQDLKDMASYILSNK